MTGVRLRLRASFFAAAGVMWLAGLERLWLVLLASVTAHELAHVLTAWRLGARVKELRLTALGQMAVIPGLEDLPAGARYAAYLAGPGASLLIAWAARLCGREDVAFCNAVLAWFNLLPFFPLDGGRAAQLFLGNRLGILRANRLLLRAGRAVGLALLLLGGVQVLLFPYNITLLCAGLFIRRENARLALPLTAAFFAFATRKNKKTGAVYPVKWYAAPEGTNAMALTERISWDWTLRARVGGRELGEGEVLAEALGDCYTRSLDSVNERR